MTNPHAKLEVFRKALHNPEIGQSTSSNMKVTRTYGETRSFERQRAILGTFFDCYEQLRNREIESAKRDLERCKKDRNIIMHSMISRSTLDTCSPTSSSSPSVHDSSEPQAKRVHYDSSCPSTSEFEHEFLTTVKNCKSDSCENLKNLEERVLRNMDTLALAYSSIRSEAEDPNRGAATYDSSVNCLADFAEVVDGITLYGQVLHVASLKYNISNAAYHSTVSSLEFSPANSCLFSVADISRAIQVFDIRNILEQPNEFHHPVAKMECDAKISCVAWSPRAPAVMVNSGYDGSLTVWDVDKARKLRKFTEHEKRCWSVCFARTENYICATGSNDCSVKVWNLNMANSVMTIKPHFVVCTVNFGFSRNELAVGSADRSIYVYDLRQPVRPTNIFVGHRQAVSYVRYLNSNELVSASTDNHLRLWDTQSATCTRILHGHLNTKNFVGLSSCGDHIITGSEDNRAYLYYKGADRPILIYDVESCSGFINGDEPSPCEPDNESEVFVSAVAWRPNSNVAIVGNNIGKVHILEFH